MKGLAELVLSLCNLLEAEGRLLRQNTFSVARKCLFLGAAILFGIAAIVFLIAALYVILRAILPAQLVLAIMGAICALVSAAFLWGAKPCVKKTAPAKAAAQTRKET